MYVFIDESGAFTCTPRRHSISAVGALIIPDALLSKVEQKYAALRGSLPTERGEVKGRLLAENHVARIVAMLARYQVLYVSAVIDMGIHDEDAIAEHKQGQAEGLTRNLTERHHPNLRAGLYSLRERLERMASQLYVQSTVMFVVIDRVLRDATFYYAQRRPQELGAFHWVIDGKDRGRITDWEDWWRYVVRPMLQSKMLREPMVTLREADYSHFERFDTTIGDHLKPHIPHRQSDQATDLNKVMTEDLRFSSEVEPGLEMVDVLVNATRRALMGNLGHLGWRDLRSLMIHQAHHYIQVMTLLSVEPSLKRWPYMPVLRHFSSGGRVMLAPRFRREGRNPS
jgi:hypothetical protein